MKWSINKYTNFFQCNISAAYFAIILFVISNMAESTELSLPQGFSAFGFNQVEPDKQIGTIILSVSDFESVKEATFTINMSPFPIKSVTLLNQDYELDYWIHDHFVTLFLSNRLTKPALEQTGKPKQGLVGIVVSINGLEFMDYVPGFGMFVFTDVEIVAFDDHPISKLKIIPGSWQIIADFVLHIPVTIIQSSNKQPVSLAKVRMVELIGGPGIEGGTSITDENGHAQFFYDPDVGLLSEQEPPAMECHQIADVKALVHLEPTDNTNITFEPFDTIIDIQIDEPNCIRFKEVVIEIDPKSDISDWSFY